jgi:hypothetical protein
MPPIDGWTVLEWSIVLLVVAWIVRRRDDE